jgi:hypothetical protein
MRIFAVTQGEYGDRIVRNIKRNSPSHWLVEKYTVPRNLPIIIDEPNDFLPKNPPMVDLLIPLSESPSLAQLIPDFAKITKTRAVIVPIDNHNWVPSGMRNQIIKELDKSNLPHVFPKPFCTLEPKTENAIINSFARFFGKPELKITVENKIIKKVEVLRGAPCGCSNFVAEKLVGVSEDNAVLQSGIFFHNYPCLASMEWDLEVNETLMHIAGFEIKKAVGKALRS